MADQDQWHRRRRPDEVPTPVAVAVSDFCRRARAPDPRPPGPAAPERRRGAKAKADADAATVAERIAPRRREKRPLPEPRGRFSQLPSQTRPVEDLLDPEIRAELQALAVQHR